MERYIKGCQFQFSSVAQSCPTLCDPMNRNTPGFPVHHQLPEFTQIHVHRVSDAIQPSHSLSSPSPLAPNPSRHQSFPMSRVFSNTTVQKHQFLGAQPSSQSNSHFPYFTTGKTTALTRRTLVGKVMSLFLTMLSRSHHFMANRWETVETVRDFIFLAPKSLQMVTEAMKLEDTCSLEGKS